MQETLDLIPGLGRSPGDGKGHPLQSSGLENPMNSIAHGVTKSQTGLSDFHFPSLRVNGVCCNFLIFLPCGLEVPERGDGGKRQRSHPPKHLLAKGTQRVSV